MGGPGSGRRKGGAGAKTAGSFAKSAGISKTRASVVMAKNKQMAKAAAKRKAKGIK